MGRGVELPGPGPRNRHGAGPAAAWVSVLPRLPPRRAGRNDCSFLPGPGRESRAVLDCLSVRPEAPCPGSAAARSPYPRPLEQRPAGAGHPASRAPRWGQLVSARGKLPAAGAPCWRGQVPSACRVSNSWPRQRGTFHRCLEQNFPAGPRKPPWRCLQAVPSPTSYSFLETEAFSHFRFGCGCVLRARSKRGTRRA